MFDRVGGNTEKIRIRKETESKRKKGATPDPIIG